MNVECCAGRIHCRPNFIKFFNDGYLTGWNWKNKDNYIPGGPWVISDCPNSEENNWSWRQGWKAGKDKVVGAIYTPKPDTRISDLKNKIHSTKNELYRLENLLRELIP